jgi:hypothetical protein
VQAIQEQVEKLAADIRTKRLATTGDEATRLQALERRLTGGRDAPRGKLRGIASFFNGSGAQQGTFAAPTNSMKAIVAEAKAEIAAVQKEAK